MSYLNVCTTRGARGLPKVTSADVPAGPFGAPWVALAASLVLLADSCRARGRFLVALGSPKASRRLPRASQDASWALLGRS